MARVILSSVVTNIKGKVLGHYFGGSLSGVTLNTCPYGRKGKVVNSQTTRPASSYNGAFVSTTLLYVVKYWKTLTKPQQAAWHTAAPNFPTVNKFGVPVKPSGYHTFVHINYAIVANGGSILTTPPAVSAGFYPPNFTPTVFSSSFVTATLANAVPTGCSLVVKATSSISAGVKPSAGMFRQIQVFPAATSGLIDCSLAYVNAYGYAITGDYLWLAMYLVNSVNGVKTPLFVAGQAIT